MAYADTATVNALCQNVRNLDPGDVARFVAVADSRLNAALRKHYAMPIQRVDGEYPDPLPAISALYAAGLIEAKYFSLTSTGAPINPYAERLLKEAKELLEQVQSGTLLLDGQTRQGAQPQAAAAPADSAVRTLRQLRHSGSP